MKFPKKFKIEDADVFGLAYNEEEIDAWRKALRQILERTQKKYYDSVGVVPMPNGLLPWLKGQSALAEDLLEEWLA